MAIKPSTHHNKHERDQLERYQLLVENVLDYAIFLLDKDGKIDSWNKGAEKLKGYKKHEIIGKHFSIFYTEQDKKKNKPAINLAESLHKNRVEDEGWRVRKDGSKFWADVVITPLFDEQGRHRGFAKVTRDLTERKHYEDKLQRTNQKLKASYQDLQHLSAGKDEFVSLASHQLRTPATGVKQYLALLLEGYAGELSEQQIDYLKKAYDSNDRQLEIVNDLLQVAQLDAGQVVLNRSPTDINDLIENIIDENADTLKNRRQKISLNLPKKTWLFNVDSVRFRMVLENLIDNASKYTPEHGEITISLKPEKHDLKISVADNGIGISKSEIPKLFEKFTRLSNPLTRNVTGSGLGLYWADKIVRLHNGHISISSKPGKGTTFTITIPSKDLYV